MKKKAPEMLTLEYWENTRYTPFVRRFKELYGIEFDEFVDELPKKNLGTTESEYEAFKRWYLVRYTKLGRALL